jgi:hypothetical protein
VAEVIAETRHWRRTAILAGISRTDIDLTAAAFAETEGYTQHLSPAVSNAQPARAAKLELSVEEMQAKAAVK